MDGVARALVPGGSFLVDTINLLSLARGFQELDWEEYESGTLMVERREFDFRRGRSRATGRSSAPTAAAGAHAIRSASTRRTS